MAIRVDQAGVNRTQAPPFDRAEQPGTKTGEISLPQNIKLAEKQMN
jgi:hypothetical protein